MINDEINSLDAMIGKTSVKMNNGVAKYSDVLAFLMSDGMFYVFYHEQDCCEAVYIEDIAGDLNDLIGTPLVQAEETSNEERDNYCDKSQTWTFYKFATNKGSVTIRWLGESNGYYSESVDLRVFNTGENVPSDIRKRLQ